MLLLVLASAVFYEVAASDPHGGLARKIDRVDARVLAELARRDLVPALWVPSQPGSPQLNRSTLRPEAVGKRGVVRSGREPCGLGARFIGGDREQVF